MASVPGRTMGGACSPGDGPGKIVNEETGENFLEDQFRLLCVKMNKTHRVFQTTEGGFNTPAHGVELSQGGYRELPGI